MVLDFAVWYCPWNFMIHLQLFLKSHISGWDIHDAVYSRELLISNRENGYHDILASIDLSTYRRLPWENNVPFFLVSFFDPETHEPLCVDPRGVLRKATNAAKARGRECISGVEYEVWLLEVWCPSRWFPVQYFNFKETPDSLAQKKFMDLKPLTSGSALWFNFT
jgi:glutamine synthetase